MFLKAVIRSFPVFPGLSHPEAKACGSEEQCCADWTESSGPLKLEQIGFIVIGQNITCEEKVLDAETFLTFPLLQPRINILSTSPCAEMVYFSVHFWMQLIQKTS